MARDNVVSFESSAESVQRRAADARLKNAIEAVRGLVAGSLPHLLQGLFERLDDELFEFADKSENDVLQTRYFEVMRELRKLHDSIEKSFLDGQLNGFDEFWVRKPGGASAPLDSQDEQELSLVDDDQLEEGLAITGMVSKSESRFHPELFAMNQRFAALLGGREVTDTDNPVGPRALVEGFAQALQCWHGEIEFRVLIYKLFDRYVLAYAGGLYDEINDALIAAGVLPKVQPRVRRNPVAPAVQRARVRKSDERHTETDERPSADAARHAEEDEEVLSVLANLLFERRRTGRPVSPVGWGRVLRNEQGEALPEVDTRELFNALNEVQEDLLATALADAGAVQSLQVELLANVARRLEMGTLDNPTKRLAQGDQDILDVMGLLFDFIFSDDNIPDTMKAMLGRLQIPLLKVAVRDRSFFSDRKHPARLLLNNLARAAAVWNDDGNHAADSVYGRIEAAVNFILLEFDDDVAVFEAANQEFESYLEQEARKAEAAEERVAQVRRGQEKLELARRRVDDVIEDALHAAEQVPGTVPDTVRGMLKDVWSDVMLLAYLREGENSPAWKDACGVVRDLVWSVQPKTEQTERQKLLSTIPALLQRVREGFLNISFDQHRSAALLRDLQACHIDALRGGRAGAAQEQAVESSAVKARETQSTSSREQRPPPRINVEPAVWEDRYYEMAQALDVGQWLEWEGTDGHWVRGKLSWRSAITESCIFVNGKGMKVQEISLVDVAARLRSHTARILEHVETPLMDRALNAMLDTLRRTDEVTPRAD